MDACDSVRYCRRKRSTGSPPRRSGRRIGFATCENVLFGERGPEASQQRPPGLVQVSATAPSGMGLAVRAETSRPERSVRPLLVERVAGGRSEGVRS